MNISSCTAHFSIMLVEISLVSLETFHYWTALDNEALTNLLLFGDEKLDIVSNGMILEATISFIEKTKRRH